MAEIQEASEKVSGYFARIQKEVEDCYDIANRARKKGYDPEERADIPLAKNMAERVEGLMSIVAPQLVGKGVPERISELEEEHGMLAWEVALLIAAEVAQEKFCTFKDKKEAMEVGIRTGFAYNTLGIVAAPLEGFIELKIKQRQDGKEYVAASYAGPIRGAGGTAASVSVIIVDYVRTVMGYERYDPTEKEIKRFKAEIRDYHERVTNLQYFPSDDEIGFMMKNLPVEVDGEPTEKIDVSNHKDLPRVETNKIRGGMCLVVAEGLTQKSPKLWKRLSRFGEKMGLSWGFLEDFLALQKKIKAKAKSTKSETKEKITPNYTFIKDLVAGRPIFTYPMRKGGLRLRYGRSRMSGFSTAGMNPLSLLVLSDYIGTGTQLKTERPGKAATITPNDSVEGPIIKLTDGSVVKITSREQAIECRKKLEKILFMGDICLSYGDFSENGHVLVPAGYCQEWWILELKKVLAQKYQDNFSLGSSETNLSEEKFVQLLKEPIATKITFNDALSITNAFGIPLHPDFLSYWSILSKEELTYLVTCIDMLDASLFTMEKVVFPNDDKLKSLLESIGLPHVVSQEGITLEGDVASSFYTTMKRAKDECATCIQFIDSHDDVMECMNFIAPFTVRDLAGTFIGARMGRPEKAKMRRLKGDPHALFPVGDEGGRMRCFQSALQKGKVTGDFPVYLSQATGKETIYPICEETGEKTEKKTVTVTNHYGTAEKSFKTQTIDINHYYSKALETLGMRAGPDLVKGVRGTSNEDHIPEHLAKGILRAHHKIYVNKDGTTRYDMSELPLTHFKPHEIGASVEKLKELGYDCDYLGNPLVSDDQIVEIFPQDVIIPDYTGLADEPCSAVCMRIAQFLDDLLEKFYGQERFYNVKKKEDLIGHLVIGLAPHISAGMIGRIIGFSNTQGMLTHPLFHAGMRRDCDGDEACVIMLMDALLNFSRQFLPNRRGAKTMDSPLVLTSKLNPAEVDDQVHGLDIQYSYPLELYEAALEYKNPWDVKVEQIKHHLGTERQYENHGFTHHITNINKGILCSAYKTLPSMKEKLDGQMLLAERICAVDEADVAAAVVQKHFLKDLKGNLRKFSYQEFRCVGCNEKFRRPPLLGKCTSCGGKIIFTISPGSVVKYLIPSVELVTKYEVSTYLRQTIELVKRHIEDNFGKEKEKQMGLAAFS